LTKYTGRTIKCLDKVWFLSVRRQNHKVKYINLFFNDFKGSFIIGFFRTAAVNTDITRRLKTGYAACTHTVITHILFNAASDKCGNIRDNAGFKSSHRVIPPFCCYNSQSKSPEIRLPEEFSWIFLPVFVYFISDDCQLLPQSALTSVLINVHRVVGTGRLKIYRDILVCESTVCLHFRKRNLAYVFLSDF